MDSYPISNYFHLLPLYYPNRSESRTVAFVAFYRCGRREKQPHWLQLRLYVLEVKTNHNRSHEFILNQKFHIWELSIQPKGENGLLKMVNNKLKANFIKCYETVIYKKLKNIYSKYLIIHRVSKLSAPLLLRLTRTKLCAYGRSKKFY